MAVLFALGRPPKFMVEGVKESVEQETAVECEVSDVKFEENLLEVVRLTVCPHNSLTMRWALIKYGEVAGTEVYDLAYHLGYR